MEDAEIQSKRRSSRWLFFLAVGIAICAVTVFGPRSTAVARNATVPPPAWMEPRGVNIVDLVGLVPEHHLQGAIISYSNSTGILQYVEGRRTGNQVQITARAFPRYFTYGTFVFTNVGCLGQYPTYDHWPSASPASSVELYADGKRVTHQISSYQVVSTALSAPLKSSSEYDRYPWQPAISVSPGDQPLILPGNMGCLMILPGRLTNVTAFFTLQAPQRIAISPLGSQTFDVHSYVGPGSAGILQKLSDQLSDRFGRRHDKPVMAVPAQSDFVLVNYPPTPVDPYVTPPDLNDGQPGSGTYRFERPQGGLTIDHVNSMALPISGQWQDHDEVEKCENCDKTWLPWLSPLLRLTAPEYFVPPGIAYDPCMKNGGCPDSLLDAIYNTTYTMSAHFYRIDRLSEVGLHRIPLRQVGPGWSPSNSSSAGVNVSAPESVQDAPLYYLPIIQVGKPFVPPVDNPEGCPCGWFDPDGRMVDFIPKPAD